MMKWRSLYVWVLTLFWLFWSGTAQASPLADRLSQFPDWQTKPLVQVAKGDLIYPDWFSGTWDVTTTLVALAAPLAPDLVTPGFEGNRQYLDQPILFQARFVEQNSGTFNFPFPIPASLVPASWGIATKQVVADRAFNGLNLATAYLNSNETEGNSQVLAVKVDPRNPNRQITFLRQNRKLVSTITGRATETPADDQFITTEIFLQEFHGIPQPYFNTVETTTAYSYHPDDNPLITADQVTAIYLSPQDPDYFEASDRPIALYRYQLEFAPAQAKKAISITP
jgi:hypothetical protein